MRFRRHLPPIREWHWPGLHARGAKLWGSALVSALVAGYLPAYLVIFPAPILHGHQVVPRVLGLSLQEGSAELRKAGLQVQDGGSEPHPTAPQGTVIWQDPPPGISAPAGLRVTLVASDGPPKIPVPDVAGLDGALAQRLVAAAGLTVAQVESVQAATPRGVAMLTRPPAATARGPGAPPTRGGGPAGPPQSPPG